MFWRTTGPAGIVFVLDCDTAEFRRTSTRGAVLSKVDHFATFKKVEVHAENSTFYKVEVV